MFAELATTDEAAPKNDAVTGMIPSCCVRQSFPQGGALLSAQAFGGLPLRQTQGRRGCACGIQYVIPAEPDHYMSMNLRERKERLERGHGKEKARRIEPDSVWGRESYSV